MLEVRSLTKYYRNVAVADHGSFTLQAVRLRATSNPMGPGKSTTVKMLTGLLEPTTGQVLLDGADIRMDLNAYKKRLVYVPEEAHVYTYLSGLEYLQLIGRLRCLQEAEVTRKTNDLLQLFSLHPHLYAPISAYSKGMKQRVLLSAALLHDPNILILGALAQSGKVILYISHVLEVVERVCAKVIIIYKGKIMADDSVANLRGLMSLPTLEDIFSELVQQQNREDVARDIVQVMQGAR